MKVTICSFNKQDYDWAWNNWHADNNKYQNWLDRDPHWIYLFLTPPAHPGPQPRWSNYIDRTSYFNWYLLTCQDYCEDHGVQQVPFDKLNKHEVIEWLRNKFKSKVKIWEIGDTWGLDWDDDCTNLPYTQLWWDTNGNFKP